MIDDLNIMKVKKQKIKEEREKYEFELGELLDSFKEKKDIELSAKLEMDQINRELREI